jgi:Na+/proline symporter
MLEHNTAGLLRLLGLIGLAISITAWALAERSVVRNRLTALSAGAALVSAIVYLIGVLAAANSGAGRFLPHFP